jgi:predicted negative regulator of RcsB-dependent stress response
MAIAEQTAERRSFIDALSFAIQRNRKVLLILLVIIIVALLGLVTVLQIRKTHEEASAERIEAVEKQYVEWAAAKEEAGKENAEQDVISKADSLEADILQAAEAVVAEYDGLYAQMRAFDILAAVAFDKKEYEKAAEYWTTLAGKHAKAYLAPIALLNAAAAWEEAGKTDKAMEALTEIVTKFSTVFPDVPRILFSLGRLAEGNQSFEDAKDYYNRLIDEYSGSSWTKLAHNRIIYLQIENKISK